MARKYNKLRPEYLRLMSIWLYAVIFIACILLIQFIGHYRTHLAAAQSHCLYLSKLINKDVSYDNLLGVPKFFEKDAHAEINPELDDLYLTHWAVFQNENVLVEKSMHEHHFFNNILETSSTCTVFDLRNGKYADSRYSLQLTTLFQLAKGELIWMILTSLLLSGFPLLVFLRMSRSSLADKDALLELFTKISRREERHIRKEAEASSDVRELIKLEGEDILRFVDHTKELNNHINPDYIKRLEQNFIDLEERNAYLAIRNKELNRLTTMKSSFFANLSHDFRTPLYTIDGYSRLLLETDLERKQLSHVNAIKTANANLLELVSNFLSLSRLEAGKIDLDYIDVDLRQLLREISCGLNFLSTEHRDHIFLDISEKLPDQIEVDGIKLRQILANLISNAVKYTYDGMIYIRVTCQKVGNDTLAINISVSDTGKGIPENDLLTIFDPYMRLDREKTRVHGTGLGLGIVKELCEVIGAKLSVESKVDIGSSFTIDFTTKLRDHHTSENCLFLRLGYKLIVYNGVSSLDLYLEEWLKPLDVDLEVRPWAELHDSKLNIPKETNSRYLVLLDYTQIDQSTAIIENLEHLGKDLILCSPLSIMPIAKTNKLDNFISLNNIVSNHDISESLSRQSAPTGSNQEYSLHNSLENFVLLLAEDNDLNRKIIEERLSSFGAQVISCPDGKAALELYKARSYSAILMDAHMPYISGTELTQIIRHDFNDKETPIIGITASTSTVEYQYFIRSGMTDCLIKPLNDTQLIESIRKFALQVDEIEPQTTIDAPVLETSEPKENLSTQDRIDQLSRGSISTHILKLEKILKQPDILDKQKTLFHEVHKLNGTLSMTSFKDLQSRTKEIENLINPMLWPRNEYPEEILLKQLIGAEEDLLLLIPELRKKI